MSERLGLYKNSGRDGESLRRNRQEHSVEIRKVKRVDQHEKRRNIDLADLSDASPLKEAPPKSGADSVKAVCKQMRSKDAAKRLEATKTCRMALSRLKKPPIEQYFKAGAVKVLTGLLKSSGETEELLIFEAAWALTNIASGESRHTAAVVEHGGIELFMKLMEHSDDKISEQSVWALSNIAGDCSEYRDQLLKLDITSVIKRSVIRFWSNIPVMQHLAWFISNLCRSKSTKYPIKLLSNLFPIIYEILLHQEDTQLLADISWGISYCTDNCSGMIDVVINHNMLPLVCKNLNNKDNVVISSIRLLGNIVAGNDIQASAVLDAGVLNYIPKLLSSDVAKILKETCWLLSNISAGNEDQVMMLVNSGVMSSVFNVLENGDFRSQKEAIWVVSNILSSKKDEPKLYLLNNNIFKYLIPLLRSDDTEMVMMILESVKDLLVVSEHYNELEMCISVFEGFGGIDVIEELQNHNSDEVYNLSYELVKEFFGAEDDEEEDEENLAKFNF